MAQATHFEGNHVLNKATGLPLFAQILIIPIILIALSIVRHIAQQTLFVNKDEPPLVFSWLPLIGSTIDYGMNPYKFYMKYQKKYGNVFSFVLVGKRHTVCLGPEGNNFVLNGSVNEISAADIYRGLTVPIFGKDVCYDCSPSKLMEQKKLLKYSLTQDKLESYVPIFLGEMQNYVENAECFQGDSGTFDVVENVAVMTIFTAAASLQGREVRENLDKDLADLYHDLDKSFIPINFYMPGLPLPVNRKRDEARTKIAAIYSNIINGRRELGMEKKDEAEDDMIWSLMRSTYKDGTPVPDHEIANMMIGLLMAGQHNSYSVASWILLRLATRPDTQEELYQEQLQVFGSDLNLESSANRDTLGRLPLHKAVVRETLRLHAPIHTVMRAIKSPLHVTSKDPQTSSDRAYRIPTSHVLISAPGVTALSEEFFDDPEEWDPRRWEAMDELAAAGENPEPGQKTLSKGAASFYLPFGAGRHRCVGEVFSYLQLSILTAYMVRNFKLHPLPGTEGVPATDYSAMITRPVAPAKLLWERRSKS